MSYKSSYTGAQIDAGIAAANTAVQPSRTVNGHALSDNVTVTASDVGLGNVTNESKATMFTNPSFTGDASFSGGTQQGSTFSQKSASASGLDTTAVITITFADAGGWAAHVTEVYIAAYNNGYPLNCGGILRYGSSLHAGGAQVYDLTHDLASGCSESVSASPLTLTVTFTATGNMTRVAVIVKDVACGDSAGGAISSISIA